MPKTHLKTIVIENQNTSITPEAIATARKDEEKKPTMSTMTNTQKKKSERAKL
jgi:hypothetical protein